MPKEPTPSDDDSVEEVVECPDDVRKELMKIFAALKPPQYQTSELVTRLSISGESSSSLTLPKECSDSNVQQQRHDVAFVQENYTCIPFALRHPTTGKRIKLTPDPSLYGKHMPVAHHPFTTTSNDVSLNCNYAQSVENHKIGISNVAIAKKDCSDSDDIEEVIEDSNAHRQNSQTLQLEAKASKDNYSFDDVEVIESTTQPYQRGSQSATHKAEASKSHDECVGMINTSLPSYQKHSQTVAHKTKEIKIGNAEGIKQIDTSTRPYEPGSQMVSHEAKGRTNEDGDVEVRTISNQPAQDTRIVANTAITRKESDEVQLIATSSERYQQNSDTELPSISMAFSLAKPPTDASILADTAASLTNQQHSSVASNVIDDELDIIPVDAVEPTVPESEEIILDDSDDNIEEIIDSDDEDIVCMSHVLPSTSGLVASSHVILLD